MTVSIHFCICQALAKPHMRYLQQNLAGICNSVCIWWLIMGWIRGGAVSGWSFLLSQLRTFVSVTPSMDILFHILGRNEVSMSWSSFLIFLCFGSCILGILGFWANIHLSVSAYRVIFKRHPQMKSSGSFTRNVCTP